MIYTKENPKGLDVWVQKLQKELYCELTDLWGLEDRDYTSYGRVYPNRKDKKTKPEAYIGNGNYTDSLLDDKVSALSFFGLGNEINIDNYKSQSVDVHVVFFVNLEKLACSKQLPVRGDLETRYDVYEILKRDLFGSVLKKEVIGVDKVLAEYTAITEADKLKFDTHPCHCFRFNLTFTYDPITK